MVTEVNVLGRQEVTVSEALQCGLVQDKIRDPKVRQRIETFINAHASKQSENLTDQPPPLFAGLAVTQVSAVELQEAVLLRGIDSSKKTKVVNEAGSAKSQKYRAMYKVLFPATDSFLEKDLQSMLYSLKNRSKCLVDLASGLAPRQKALRKFLLLEILDEMEDDKAKSELRDEIQDYKNLLLQENKEFICSTISAYEIGRIKAFKGPGLKEFIKAYQVIEIQPDISAAGDLLPLFRLVKRDIDHGVPIKRLVKMQEGFIQVLVREKTQDPNRITTIRQSFILSRIKQYGFLINFYALHERFIQSCKKANVENLPSITALMECCLQAVASDENLAGINGLIANASGVLSKSRSAKNAFITLYNRWVLQNNLLRDIYKSDGHRKLLSDNIRRNVEAGAVLSVAIK